jgi:hypothetical protein
MSWFSVLPLAATLFAEAPVSVPSADPVLAPIGGGQAVVASPAPVPQAPATRWYGAPAVAADVTEVALLYAVTKYADPYGYTVDGFLTTKRTTELLVISTLVSGAVVHGLHHHGVRAAGSVALRAGAVLAGLIGTVAIEFGRSCPQYEDGFCPNRPDIGYVLIAGLPLAAMAVDDALLAREAVPAAAQPKTAWTPTVRLQSGLAMLGVGASF